MSAAKRGGTMGTNWSRRGRGARRGSQCACREMQSRREKAMVGGPGPGKAVGATAPRPARQRSGEKRSRRGPVSGFDGNKRRCFHPAPSVFTATQQPPADLVEEGKGGRGAWRHKKKY